MASSEEQVYRRDDIIRRHRPGSSIEAIPIMDQARRFHWRSMGCGLLRPDQFSLYYAGDEGQEPVASSCKHSSYENRLGISDTETVNL
jgi:hypothetical protein